MSYDVYSHVAESYSIWAQYLGILEVFRLNVDLGNNINCRFYKIFEYSLSKYELLIF